MVECTPQNVRVMLDSPLLTAPGAYKTLNVVDQYGHNLRISLRRTIRVPDNGKSHHLVADCGPFPIYSTADHASSLPGSLAAKGGVFIPIHQREAMLINFDGGGQFGVKVYVGGVNAVSDGTTIPSTMILRNIAIRHGRKALAPPLRISFLRTLSTEVSEIESSIQNHSKESIEATINQLHAARSSVPPSSVGEDDSVAYDYNTYQNIKKRTRRLGSVVSPHYKPHKLVLNPPKPENVTLELLMASQSHLGHSTSLWNPANQRYIFGVRQGVHIISLETTAAHLRRAAKVVEGVAYHGGLILFVGTRPGQDSAVVKAAQLAQGCHLFERWIPGGITNGEKILAKCGIKAVDKDDQVLDGFDEKIAGWKSLRPDLVVVMNPLENYVLLHECGLNNIPTIGVIDTDADPTWVTYPVPANDDSLRCIQVIAGVLGRAGEAGQRKRLEAAKTGQVTWLPPPGLGRPDAEEVKTNNGARREKEAMKTKEGAKFTSFADDEDL